VFPHSWDLRLRLCAYGVWVEVNGYKDGMFSYVDVGAAGSEESSAA